MKRMLLALWAIMLMAGLGLGGSPAAAYFTGENSWLNGVSRSADTSERAGRREARQPRAARNTRATRQRAARSNDDGSRPQTRRNARRSTTLASLTGSSAGSGIASYYWQPQRVASGGWFNPNAMTAAHKTLPFGTRVRVTNLNNGRSVTVTINDRGPYVRGRVIDLSRAAAQAVGMTGAGLARVSLSVLGRG